MEIESKTLLKFETKMTKKRPQKKKKKRNIYSYSNREASLTEASVSSVAAQQHFR